MADARGSGAGRGLRGLGLRTGTRGAGPAGVLADEPGVGVAISDHRAGASVT